ncbi:hypothetical protein BC829DRAFT_442200 [Chytridium lagenaria]|nr:hypothetical protein BC829DRAFT_442200 [Chytridium lagenaria]
MTTTTTAIVLPLVYIFTLLLAIFPSTTTADFLDKDNLPVVPGVSFNFSAFDFVENGFDRTAGALTLFWSLENEGSRNEMIHAALMFNGTAAVVNGKQNAPLIPRTNTPTLLNSWFALGFGRSMLTADFLLVYINTTGFMTLFNLSPTGNYQTPITNPGPRILTDAPRDASPHVSFNRNGVALVEFRRFTTPNPNDIAHALIDPVSTLRSSGPTTSTPTQLLQQPGQPTTGLTGELTLFGLGMEMQTYDQRRMSARNEFMILFPFGIYWARYARSIAAINRQWMWVHIVIQSVGAVAASGLAIYICQSLGPGNLGPSIYLNLSQRPHPIIGFTLLGGMGLQVIFGVLNRLGLQFERLSKFSPLYRGLHDWFGRLLVILSISQVALGINTLYPWPDCLPNYTGRGFALWLAYFCITGGWMVAFFVTEVYWMAKVHQRDRGLVASKSGRSGKVNAKGVDPGKALMTAAYRVNAPEKNPLMEAGRVVPSIKTFTWEDIDRELQNGRLYVVANGKYVYDIQDWIWSHPGGQIILYSVAGTDITNDYFHEAGFDAEAFVPTAVAERRRRSLPVRLNGSNFVLAPGESAPTPPSYASQPSGTYSHIPTFPPISEYEWRHVVKARRPHVHTRLAIEKLSTLLVGELVGDGNVPMFVEGSGAVFSPLEYRRYAIIESTLESGPGTQTAVYKIKFCTLYPHDARLNEPKVFLPGQCVEIQARVSNKYVSRYFTPISGNPSSFEVMIKLEPQGALTPFLVRQKPGDRQIKSGEWALRKVLFVTAGSGLAPALQMLRFMYLPTFVPLFVSLPKLRSHEPDEISIYAGDWVIARTHLLDGWAEGVNLRTQQEGIFPLPVTYPRCGPQAQLGIIHSIKTTHDAFGGSMLGGALLAYPDQVRVWSRVTRGDGGRGDGGMLGGGLGRLGVGGLMMEEELALSRVVVCGPRAFEGFVYETLVDILGVPHQNITVLPDNQYL